VASSRVVGIVSLIAVVASGAYGSIFWIARDRGPPEHAFAPAAKIIRDDHRRDDLIFLVPFYATRAREHLGDLLPLAVRDPLAEDFAVHPRAWVFGLFGEGVELRPRMLAAGMKLEKSIEPSPGITIDLYATGATQQTKYRFLEHLRDARVHHEKQGSNTPCSAWSENNGQNAPLGGRWSCPYDADWFYVAPEWHRMDAVPRLCFWAHPPNEGRLVIIFPNVPMTGHLYGRAGHTFNGTLHARAPIHLDVQVGDDIPQRFTFELQENFRPYMLPTPETGTATVTFGVSTPDAGTNHFCFDAEMR
jgi:hypothetical protein